MLLKELEKFEERNSDSSLASFKAIFIKHVLLKTI